MRRMVRRVDDSIGIVSFAVCPVNLAMAQRIPCSVMG
jgi:hypothetical protein